MCRFIKYGAILLGLLIAGCSKLPDTDGVAGHGKMHSISVRGPMATADGVALTTSVYIFSSPASQNSYTLTENIASLGNSATYRFYNGDLVSKDYRFLFITTGVQPEIGISTKSGNQPIVGTAWEDILLRILTATPGMDNYYAVETLTGKQIESTDRITGRLNRIVGQAVYDFTRSSDATAVVPTDIVSPDVQSVLDRVYEIKTIYTGVPQTVGFNADGTPVPYGTYGEVTQTVTLNYDPANIKVSVPQTENGIEPVLSGARGGARVMGLYMLPCNESVTVNMTFSYFDTTPSCGNNHPAGESHDTTCYDKRSITLAIPPAAFPKLSILRDTYTVSKIGLPCDRVIDIPETQSLNLDFKWN